MVKLSEFVGEIVSELSQARQLADASSVQLSQTYHADSFLRELPIPHYTIEEAEVEFPLSIVDMISDSSEDMENSILTAIKLKLPAILFLALKTAYLDKKKAGILKEQEEQQAKQNLNGIRQERTPADEVLINLDKDLDKRYRQAADTISRHMVIKMKNYISTINLNVMKPLDIKDVFMDMLQKEYIAEFNNYETEKQPIADDDSLAGMIQSVGTSVFFEFTKPEIGKGILVDPGTGRLSEYNSKDTMLYIKLKIKEQDLDFVVTGKDENGNAKRFLSIS